MLKNILLPSPPVPRDLQAIAWFEELGPLQDALMLGLLGWLAGFLEVNELFKLW
jgi:hypothetical protein